MPWGGDPQWSGVYARADRARERRGRARVRRRSPSAGRATRGRGCGAMVVWSLDRPRAQHQGARRELPLRLAAVVRGGRGARDAMESRAREWVAAAVTTILRRRLRVRRVRCDARRRWRGRDRARRAQRRSSRCSLLPRRRGGRADSEVARRGVGCGRCRSRCVVIGAFTTRAAPTIPCRRALVYAENADSAGRVVRHVRRFHRCVERQASWRQSRRRPTWTTRLVGVARARRPRGRARSARRADGDARARHDHRRRAPHRASRDAPAGTTSLVMRAVGRTVLVVVDRRPRRGHDALSSPL